MEETLMRKAKHTSGIPALAPPQSASQRVKDFILKEAENRDSEESWRLPSIRQLAAHLDVSMATVQNVYSSLASEGRVTSAAKRGSFYHSRTAGRNGETLHIGLAFVWDEDARHAWENSIYAGILDASLACGKMVNFSRFSSTKEGLADVRKAHMAGRLDGMVILPGCILQPLTELCTTLNIPVAFLLPESLTSVSNFVCPDVLTVASQIAGAFIEAGRQRLAFVEYVVNDNKAYYALYRAGFLQGILDRKKSLDGFVHIALESDDTRVADISRILQSPQRPDAMLCGGDNMAMDVLHVAKELGLKVPEQLSVISGSGVLLHDPRMALMTRVQQPVKQIGLELFRLVESLASRAERAQPGHYVPCGLVCGETTTTAENRALERAAASKCSGL